MDEQPVRKRIKIITHNKYSFRFMIFSFLYQWESIIFRRKINNLFRECQVKSNLLNAYFFGVILFIFVLFINFVDYNGCLKKALLNNKAFKWSIVVYDNSIISLDRSQFGQMDSLCSLWCFLNVHWSVWAI